MNKYDEITSRYPEFVVLKKEGLFYAARSKSAIVVNNLYGFRLCLESGKLKTGCPMNLLEKVVEGLEKEHINFLVVDSDEILQKKEYKNNAYSKFNELSKLMTECIEQQFERMKKNQISSDELKQLSSITKRVASVIDKKGEALLEENVPKEEVLEQLQKISHILDELANNHGRLNQAQKYHQITVPYQLSEEEKAKITFDGEKTITDFVHMLNEHRSVEYMNKLDNKCFIQWLVSNEYLHEELNQFGQKVHTATIKGTELGIRTEKRQGGFGEYVVNLYDETAQRTLLDVLPALI